MSKKTCKLYRNVSDIINPSISRKNISDYKILFNDELVPVQIYYPSIDTILDRVTIYVHGRELCNDFYEEYALKTNNIVIVIDYSKENYEEELVRMINYIIEELVKQKIEYKNITLLGDFTGSDLIIGLSDRIDSFNELDKILISPIDDDLSKYEFNNVLILSNNEEQIPNDKMVYNLIKESLYDFIHDIDIITNEKIYKYILSFIERR